MNGDSDVDETDMDSSLDSMSGNPLVLLVGDFYERQKKSPLAFFSARVSVATSARSLLILRSVRGKIIGCTR